MRGLGKNCSVVSCGLLAALALVLPTMVHGQANSWTNSLSAKWETASNWSLGAPPTSNQFVFVTNAVAKTVLADSTTVAAAPASLTISNLTLNGASGATNVLSGVDLPPATPLTILTSSTVGQFSEMRLTNSNLRIGKSSTFAVDGILRLTGGQLVSTTATLRVGQNAQGQMIVSNGIVNAGTVEVSLAFANYGTVTLVGGTLTASSVTLSVFGNARGTLWLVSNSQMTATSLTTGQDGGDMGISNSTFTVGNLQIGQVGGGVGTLRVEGGTLNVSGNLALGSAPTSAGSLWVNGSQITVTNDFIAGQRGDTQLLLTNSTLSARNIVLSGDQESSADVTIHASVVTATGSLTAGAGGVTASSSGTITITGGGQLSVTNGTTILGAGGTNGFARLVISNGTFLARDMMIGRAVGGSGSLTIAAGTLQCSGAGTLDLRRGGVLLDGGNVGLNSLQITNGSSGTFTFRTGTLTAQASAVTNSFPFVVGNATNPATFQITGGIHAFGNGLKISTNAALRGCGTIAGSVVNEGTIAVECGGGALTFLGAVTNSFRILAQSGGQLAFYGLVVNNGTIDASSGSVQFFGGVTNNGAILLPPQPTPPSALSATAISSNQINLAWSDNSTNELGFLIERAPDTNGVPGTFGQIASIGSNVTAYSDTNLTATTMYWYRVRAYNGGGNSPYSNQANALTLPYPTALTITGVSANSIALSWTNLFTNQDGFKVETSTDGSNFVQIAQLLPATMTYRHTKLFPNATYFYRVRGFNSGGNFFYSNIASAMTSNICSATILGWGLNTQGQSTPPSSVNDAFTIAGGYYYGLALKTNGVVIGWGQEGVPSPAISNVIAVAAGNLNAIGITRNRDLIVWGNGAPTPPADATNVSAVAAGSFHFLAVKGDGTVRAWGGNVSGESTVPAGLSNVIAVAGGQFHSLALKSDGSVVGWGQNTAGQASPPALTDAIAIAAGASFSIALRANGTVVGWGSDSLGQLDQPPGLSGVIAISAGDTHVLALKSDRTIVSWGASTFGQTSTPVGVSAVVDISAGREFSLAMSCAPAIPSPLLATNIAADQIALSWTDNSSNEDGFKLERAPDSGGAPGTWSPLAIVGPNTTAYTNTSLTLNTKYWYRVRSYNSAADSGFSNQVGLPTQPSAPINLFGTPVYTNEIDLSWTDLSGYEDGFKIERAPDSGGVPGVWAQIMVVAANTTAYSDMALTANAKYWYRLRAFNSAGDSVYTSALGVTIPAAPSTPSGLGATPINSTQIDLAWTDNANNEDGSKIERAPDNSGAPGAWAQIATTIANITSYSDLGLVASTKYWYRVRDFNPGGDSPYSNQTNATTFGQNSWINPSSGRWEIAANWSAGIPPASNQYGAVITNANIKTVTIDATTVSSNAINGCMTVSNLTVAGVAGSVNTLQLTNAGTVTPLRISNVLTLTSGAGLLITNSAVQVSFNAYVGDSGAGTLSLPAGSMSVASNLVLGTSASATGTVWLTGGALNLTNPSSTTIVGNLGDGNVVVSNGTMLSRNLILGSNVFSRGTFTVAGGSVILSNATVGLASNSFGNVWVTGGEFALTNNRVLTIGSFGAGQVTVSNAGILRVPSVFMGLRSGGVGTLTLLGANAFINSLSAGTGSNGLASVWVSGGQLMSTNGGIALASSQSTAQMTVSNATVQTRDLTIANGIDSTGTFTMNGGTLLFSSALTSNYYIGVSTGSKGAVWINGGQVTATNNGCLMLAGIFGKAQYTVTNGAVTIGNAVLSYLETATLTLAGGSFSVMGDTTVAFASTGTVWVTGGQLYSPNGTFVLGNFGVGQLTVSSGVAVVRSMIISSNAPAAGALTIPGGQVTVFDQLTVGDCASNALGQILVNGGQLYVTNAAHTGYLDLRGGTLTINSGTVIIDRLVMTNSCGHFVRTGGTLSIMSTNLGAGLDADGDGLANDWEQMFGFNPLSSVGAGEANGDPDGDGFTNLQEYLAGTDPTNSASAFRITAITQEGDDVRLTWVTTGGRTNVLRAASSLSGVYFNITPKIVIPGVGGIVTNYLDKGAATNSAGRFYRVAAGGTWIPDSSAPILIITSPADNSYTTNASVTVTGTCADVSGVAGVTVNDSAASSINGYSNWVAVVTGLLAGTNTLTVLAGDNAAPANIATNVIHVIYAAGGSDGNGDGLADLWQIQYFSCVGCPNAAPGVDPDGDNFTNLQEYLAGTDPTNSASAFRITSITRASTNILVTWTMGSGRTNALQRTAGGVSGSFSTNDFATIFTVTNTASTTTNYLDYGAATNVPALYYRVLLVP